MKQFVIIVLIGLFQMNASIMVPSNADFDPVYMVEQESKHKYDYKVQIALLLDTSNSMDGLINQAKAQLWDIVNEFTYVRCGNEVRPRLEIALYQYGNNNLSSREGYIQQVLGFSSDLDEISEK